LKDRVWPTSEHYFEAQKFAGTEHEEKIRLIEIVAEFTATSTESLPY
jgi:hypothetical protein